MLELIVSDRAGYIGVLTGQRGNNRGRVNVRKRRKSGFNRGRGRFGLKSGCEKLVGPGSESRNSSGVSTSELLKTDVLLKTV